MRILITGAQGYIGPELSKYLKISSDDFQLFGVDLGWFASDQITQDNCDKYLDSLSCKSIAMIEKEDLFGIDAVVNLAAISNDPIGNQYEKLTDQINRIYNIQLAEKCVVAGVKQYIFASSCSVYGTADSLPRNETHKVQPLTAYAKSKIDSEIALKALNTSMRITCFRFATACGFSGRFRRDLVVNDFALNSITKSVIEIKSDGSPIRPMISLKDISRIIHWALIHRSEIGEQFEVINAGYNSENYTVKEIGEMAKGIFVNCGLTINDKAAPDKRSYKVDFSKLANMSSLNKPLQDVQACFADLAIKIPKTTAIYENMYSKRLIRLKKLETMIENGALNNELEWLKTNDVA